MFKLLGGGSAGGSIDGGKIGQVRFLQGIDDPLEGLLEVGRVVVIPTAIEFIADSNQEGMVRMIADKINQFADEMIVGSVRDLVLGIAFHGNREVHHATIQSGRIEVGFLVHRTGGPFGLGIQTIDFSSGKGSAILIAPPFGEINIVGDPAGNAHIVDIPIPVLEGASGGFVVLPGKDQNLSGRGRKAGGVAVSVQDGA